MTSGLWGLFDGLTRSFALVVVGAGAVLIGWMVYRWRRAKAQLESLGPDTYEADDLDSLGQALQRQVIRKSDGPRSKVLVREHPDATIEAWLDRSVLHHVAFEAGGWITGLALIFTFLLIALVLADDVGPAIKSTSNMGGLSEAVRKMGAKFVVSMLGIFLTIAHGFCRSLLSGDLHERASGLSSRFSKATVVLADYNVLTTERIADHAERISLVNERIAGSTEQIFGVMQAQHQQLIDDLAQLAMCIQRLGSIEVSVQNIGSELSARLQHVVKNDIVAGIRKDLEDVTDRLCEALSESFSTTVREQLGTVNGRLHQIETAIAAQAHGQVEELLHKLGDAVSGGFTTESSRMKEALSRFVEVVPMLEQQMRTLIRTAGEDLARQGADTARVSEALVGQLERVLEGLEHQERSSAALGQQMANFVAQTEETLARSVSDAQQQMTERSKVNLEELTSAMRTATGDAAEVYRAMVKEVQDATSTLRMARTEAAETAQHLGQSATSVREITRHVNDSMSALRGVSESLAKNVDAARGAVHDGAQVLQGSVSAVKQQQRFVEDLSGRWPQLTREYLDATNQAFTRVAAAWTDHVSKIEQSVGRISNGFNESASEFAIAVEDLGTQLQDLKQVVQTGTPPRPRAT